MSIKNNLFLVSSCKSLFIVSLLSPRGWPLNRGSTVFIYYVITSESMYVLVTNILLWKEKMVYFKLGRNFDGFRFVAPHLN